ncbi:MAG: hypothetical protein DLM68_16690 [Hyphomicrobiales bacterium]|nr:MAG: hypothetical protein DLM68_16690 [Hyphomicrobiales bacterium]
MSLLKHSTNSNLRFLPRHLRAWFVSQIAALHPDCFALVMATGIISNALFLEGYHQLSELLFVTNAPAYPWLAILTVMRAVRFPQAVWLDLTNPRLVFSFFTLVAANDVFGDGIHLRGVAAAALHLWILALFTWFVLTYFSFGVLAFRNTSQWSRRRSWRVAASDCRHRILGDPRHAHRVFDRRSRSCRLCARPHAVGCRNLALRDSRSAAGLSYLLF